MLLALLILALSVGQGAAQKQRKALAEYEGGWAWYRAGDESMTELTLYRFGKQIGSWLVLEGRYYPLNSDGSWGEPRPRAPVKLPREATNFGVEMGRLPRGPARVLLPGARQIGAQEARALIAAHGDLSAGGTVPELASKVRVVVIGSGREQVEKDWNAAAELAPYKQQMIFQSYAPDHWHVAKVGYVVTGTPSIYVVAGDGTVLHRQADYSGPGELARVLGGLRVPAPDYDKRRDPDRRWPWQVGRLKLPWTLWLLPIGAAMVLAILIARKKKP
jgi:hypothetical protein